MSNNLKKVALFLTVGLVSFNLLSSCGKKDNKKDDEKKPFTITASDVMNSKSELKKVVALSSWEIGVNNGDDTVGTATYENNGFTLTLNDIVSEHLAPVNTVFEEMIDSVQISDSNANIAFLEEIIGLDENNTLMGYFSYGAETVNTEYLSNWVYVDKDVTVNGQIRMEDGLYKSNFVYEMSFKKGWNEIYAIMKESYDEVNDIGLDDFKITTQKPENIVYKWRLEEDEFRSKLKANKKMPFMVFKY
ncbi:MAG TPA: hypothetical protein VLZ83_06390 [Edaphocola sp.]|nr:hypothetical protein [Edaphocola sp.]